MGVMSGPVSTSVHRHIGTSLGLRARNLRSGLIQHLQREVEGERNPRDSLRKNGREELE